MISYFDLLAYFNEWMRNRFLTKNLYWFKKYKGIKWIKGQNFGDYLSCIVVAETARKLGLKKINLPEEQRFLAIGSVLHSAQDGDIIWGSGINGKIAINRHTFSKLDVRMVRGPKTKNFLEKKGIKVCNVFGDPALLLPILLPDYKRKSKLGKITILPNLNEIELVKKRKPKFMHMVSPLKHWKKILYEIITSELVLTSSLHGIVLAEAFKVPVRFVMPMGGETLFKYQDYYLGTGRSLEDQPSSFYDRITLKSGIAMPPPKFYPERMLATFPKDIFI